MCFFLLLHKLCSAQQSSIHSISNNCTRRDNGMVSKIFLWRLFYLPLWQSVTVLIMSLTMTLPCHRTYTCHCDSQSHYYLWALQWHFLATELTPATVTVSHTIDYQPYNDTSLPQNLHAQHVQHFPCELCNPHKIIPHNHSMFISHIHKINPQSHTLLYFSASADRTSWKNHNRCLLQRENNR